MAQIHSGVWVLPQHPPSILGIPWDPNISLPHRQWAGGSMQAATPGERCPRHGQPVFLCFLPPFLEQALISRGIAAARAQPGLSHHSRYHRS